MAATRRMIDSMSAPTMGWNWRGWLTGIICALLVHLLFLTKNVEWRPPGAVTPVEIQPVDPAKLQAIRKQWRQQQLLLNRNRELHREEEAPPDAKFFSDRNIRVKKEQRARLTDILPRSKSRSQKKASKIGQLGLGLPLVDGGDQAVFDDNLPTGDEQLLNAQESVYYSFYARIYEAIGPIWQRRIREVASQGRYLPRDYTTQVDVSIDADGRVTRIQIMKSSGTPEFDRVVEEAWGKVGPFPNPPKELINHGGEAHTAWSFTLRMEETSGIQFVPPQRIW